MRLEYIDDGSAESPLILLAGRNATVLAALRDALRDRLDGHPLPLHDLPGLTPVDGIKLRASIGKRDHGVHRLHDGSFSWVMDADGWRQVIDLLAPMVDAPSGGFFEYLSTEGPVTVIASSEGTW